MSPRDVKVRRTRYFRSLTNCRRSEAIADASGLTTQAQPRRNSDVVRECGYAGAIRRWLQRFVRRRNCHSLNLLNQRFTHQRNTKLATTVLQPIIEHHIPQRVDDSECLAINPAKARP